MKPWVDVPVFDWYAGQLTTTYVGQYIRSAQENFPEARRLVDAEREALELLDALTKEPASTCGSHGVLFRTLECVEFCRFPGTADPRLSGNRNPRGTPTHFPAAP